MKFAEVTQEVVVERSTAPKWVTDSTCILIHQYTLLHQLYTYYIYFSFHRVNVGLAPGRRRG